VIRARTAVLHRESDKGTRFELGREVAALIPGAALIPLPGSSHDHAHPPRGDQMVAERSETANSTFPPRRNNHSRLPGRATGKGVP
jgi:hypothetical protein